eukprot:6805001-Pyramimonas_sp.AAC.1
MACDGDVFNEGKITDKANPWARQAHQDILSLHDLEDGRAMLENQTIFSILFEDPTDFIKID